MENPRIGIKEEGIIIRKFHKDDTDSVRNIAWDTAFMGEPADAFFEDKEILEDFLTLYFTAYEPESCFVAEKENRIIGYLLGAKDTNVISWVFAKKILPCLLFKAVARGTLFKPKNAVFIKNLLKSMIKKEFKQPDFHKSYPAVLHINLKKGFRGQGIGSNLISAYIDYLTKQNITGLHLATMSEKAKEFFAKTGFTQAYRASRSYFKYILHKEISVYIYAKNVGQ